MPSDPLRVFISYSHDSTQHEARVLALADRLRADGIDAMIDQYQMAPSEGWQLWMEKQIRDSSFVLLVCTETYLRRVMKEDDGKGLGVMWESSIIYSFLYNRGVVNGKFIPVVFDRADTKYIPTPLQPTTHYCIGDDAGYDSLYRRLTEQPAIPVPPLGTRRAMPPLARPTTAHSAAPAPNPFIDQGCIDDPARFFDRESETKRILDALARNNCVSIVGDSKMGKSSLLHLITKQGAAKIANTQFAYLTMQKVTSGSSFYELACRVLGGSGKHNRDLGRLLDSGQRTIFCLDEMEKLSKGYGDDIRSFLRGYADGTNAPLKLVTASRQTLAQLFPDNAGKTSPLYNIFTDIITLANFSRADCDRFLDARLANTNVVFDAATRDEIWNLTQGHPYKLQRAAHQRYEFASDPTYDWHARFTTDLINVK